MFGIAAIVVMLCSFDMEYDELLANLRRAGMWFCGRVMDYYLSVQYPFLVYYHPGWKKGNTYSILESL